MTFQVLQGDCVELMAAMPAGSVDAVVCDPPYGIRFMGKAWDGANIDAEVARRKRRVAEGQDDEHNAAFAGAAGSAGIYDISLSANQSYQRWCEEWARECLRVLKPGGHLLASCGTRTYHRMTSGIEDAGFEIRDTICWLYGSGFPKSLDVSKAIDRAQGAEREQVPATGGLHKNRNLNDDGWSKIGEAAPLMDGTAPATPEAERWEGWGTALKPSHEIVVCGVKPDATGERDRIDESLCLLGNQIASLSPANPAVASSGSSEAEHDAALLASARWTADERSSTRDALFAQMDTSQFESAISLSLSIVSSWRITLAELSNDGNTSTTETGSDTTTDLRTLSCCLLGTTPRSIIEAATSLAGPTVAALPVARAFAAVALRLNATRELSALETATSSSPTLSQHADVKHPAHEPVVVARKPLSGTVAATVLEHGTGALNIDGTRVGNEERTNGAGSLGTHGIYGSMERNDSETTAAGRWPANVVLDDEAARLLDEQTGESGAHGLSRGASERDSRAHGGGWTDRGEGGFGDSGGASRFFYCAKSSRGERNAGLEGLGLPPESATYEWGDDKKVRTCDDCARHFANNFDRCPRCGGAWSWQAGLGGGVKGPRGGNHHPTVKPISLMRWLVRLVTPPGGTVLDPFCGSGSTGCAAVLEGFDFIGLEREAEYVAITQARIAWWHKHRGDGEAAQILAAGEARDEVEATGQSSLF